jgi:hypothetical protein
MMTIRIPTMVKTNSLVGFDSWLREPCNATGQPLTRSTFLPNWRRPNHRPTTTRKKAAVMMEALAAAESLDRTSLDPSAI